MPSLTQLEYVVAVDTHRHFGKAARACFVTQPTLSMQLQKLEEELGVVIFDRNKKPILPTQVGQEIINQAKVVLSEFKKINFISQQDQKEVSGDFHLAVIPTLAPYIIPLFLEKFSADYPKVNLKIEEMQTSSIIRALENDQIDAGLLATPLYNDGLKEDVLFYEPFYLYVNRDHRLAKKAKVHEDDIDGSEIWLMQEGHCFRNQIVKFCSLRKNRAVLKNVQFESGNLETLKRLVEHNTGSTLIPYLALQEDPAKNPSAVSVEFAKPIPSREVSLVYRRIHLKQAIIQALHETIVECLPKELRDLKKAQLEVLDI